MLLRADVWMLHTVLRCRKLHVALRRYMKLPIALSRCRKRHTALADVGSLLHIALSRCREASCFL